MWVLPLHTLQVFVDREGRHEAVDSSTMAGGSYTRASSGTKNTEGGTTMRFRLSRFCHFIDGRNGFVALYNALTLGVVIVDKKTAQVLKDAQDGVVTDEHLAQFEEESRSAVLDAFVKHKLLIPNTVQTDSYDLQALRGELAIKRVGILYLLMTDACNLACQYCFVENALPVGYRPSLMSRATAEMGINLFASTLMKSHGIAEPQIIFYGGEPFLNWSVMEYALNHISGCKSSSVLPSGTTITINTNGTLISESMIPLFKRTENLSIAISMDGPKNIHDLCRPYHQGTGTFDDAMRGYYLLRQAGIEAGLCCTISRHNVHELIRIARWFTEELGVRSLGFNLIIESPTANDVRGDMEAYAVEASRQLIDCFLYFRRCGVYEDRVMRKVNAFVEGTVYYYDCGGCGQQLVISPDGMVGVCQGYCGTRKNFIQPDETFDPLTHPLWDEWRSRSPLAMPQCQTCIALSVCGGGCPYSADIRTGSIWGLDEVFCMHAKATVEFLIKDLIENVAT